MMKPKIPGVVLPTDSDDLIRHAELRQELSTDFVKELFDSFLRDGPPRLAAIRRAVEQRDATALERVAYSLKSSSSSLGAHALERLCSRLLKQARQGELDGADHLVVELEEQFDVVRARLTPKSSQP